MGAVTEAAMSGLTQLSSAAMPMAQCVPTNDMLAGPMGGLIKTMTGAAGGLLIPMFILVVVIGGVVLLALALTKNASNVMKGLGLAAAAVIAVPLFILLVTSVQAIANGACPA
jgi:hypothetical protein